MTDAPPLDQYQQRVVEAHDQSIRVVAPAGSGKTETLVRRVEHRIGQGVAPSRILVLTFDNNARNSFTSRLARLGAGQGVEVKTLNAYGLKLLGRMDGEVTESTREYYFPEGRVLNELINDYGYTTFSGMVSKIKNEVIDLRTVRTRSLTQWIAKNRTHLLRDLENEEIVTGVSEEAFARELADAALGYEAWLREKQRIDFDDQKLRTLLRLRESPDMVRRVQASLDEVIVDEFQDVNRLDCELIKLVAENATLVITGDDDQAIYGFRGASAEHLIQPKGMFGRSFAQYELSINYRCPIDVVEVSQRLVRHNAARIAKQPQAKTAEKGTIETINAASPEHEADAIARRLGDLLGPHSQIRTAAMLTRTRAQLTELQESLLRGGVPYTVAVEHDIRVTWSQANRLLRISADRADDADARREIVRIFLQAQGGYRDHIAGQLIDAAGADGVFPSPMLVAGLHERHRQVFLKGIEQIAKGLSPSYFLKAIGKFLRAETSSFAEGKQSTQRSRLAGFTDLAQDHDRQPKRVIREVEQLLDAQRGALRDAAVPKVELLTCHGAKGREWELVVLPRLVQGVFPDQRSDEGEYLEAERKLCYVSMTRASKHLICSFSQTRSGSRGDVKAKPSVFLIEAGLQREAPSASRSSTVRGSQLENSHRAERARPKPAMPWEPAALKTRPRQGQVPRPVTLVCPRGRLSGDGGIAKDVRAIADRAVRFHDHYGVEWPEMEMRYSPRDPESTAGLQLEFAMRGIPFAISADNGLTHLEPWRAMDAVIGRGSSLTEGTLGADAVRCLLALLEHRTKSRDHAIWRRAMSEAIGGLTSERQGVRFVGES